MSVTYNAIGSDKTLLDITGIINASIRGEYFWGTASGGKVTVPAGTTDWSVKGQTISVGETGLYLVILEIYTGTLSASKGRLSARIRGDNNRTIEGLCGYEAAKGGSTFCTVGFAHLTAGNTYTVEYNNSTDVDWSTGNDATVQKIMAVPIMYD